MITQRLLSGGSGKPIINQVSNYNGFNLIRYADSYGTIIEYNWPTSSGGLGERRAIEVIDAQYRFTAAYASSSNYNYDMPNLTNFATAGNDGSWYVYNKTTYDYKTAIPTNVTAFQNSGICSQWRNLYSDKTAKYNTDQWMSDSRYNGSSYAPYKTRAITVDGGGWDIPNEFQLIVIYCCSDKLDELDPTFNSNKAYGLGYTATYGRFYMNNIPRIWSSTEYSSRYVRAVYYNGYCSYTSKDHSYGVVPVREITL